MRKQRTQYKGTEERRIQIVDAALACFTEMGFQNTIMEDIRLRSGASNGSIYHHFNSKEQLAATVYLQGIVEYQAEMVEELNKVSDAHEGIRTIIRHHVSWVCEHPDWARYLFRMRHADFMSHVEEAMTKANREYETTLGNFFRNHIESGTLRRLPKELFVSIIFGPCQELSRHWLSTKMPADIDNIVNELGEAAWRALSLG
ncbi:MAG: TetR/AcrR family transcriptional regulator [Myxococcota bacterium]|jgi:AcrR family transcriptional regulator